MLKIIVFTFLIGGMVGVVAANGGTRAAVERIARWASTRARGQLATWFAGLIVIFDDYGSWEGQRRATDEFFEARGMHPFLIRTCREERVLVKLHEDKHGSFPPTIAPEP